MKRTTTVGKTASGITPSDAQHSPSSEPGLRHATSILVVDDMEDNRDLHAMILDRLGHTIDVAVDGVDGVERARAGRPALILMDLAMPNMDGFEATRRIRAIPALAGVYIIAISAFTDTVSKQRALAAGCDEVLAKPCSPNLLSERVAAGLRHRGCERDAG